MIFFVTESDNIVTGNDNEIVYWNNWNDDEKDCFNCVNKRQATEIKDFLIWKSKTNNEQFAQNETVTSGYLFWDKFVLNEKSNLKNNCRTEIITKFILFQVR